MNEWKDDVQMEDMASNIVVLHDQDGNDTEFLFLGTVEYEGAEYAALMPTEDFDGEIVILKIIEEDGEEQYASVEDEETLDAVFEVFKEQFKNEFEFTDEE